VREGATELVTATAELKVTVNGAPLQSNGGDVFRVVYSDDASAPRVQCE
jgi:hypothetical protein